MNEARTCPQCPVSVSRDERYLATRGYEEGTNSVRFTIWDVPSRTALATYEVLRAVPSNSL